MPAWTRSSRGRASRARWRATTAGCCRPSAGSSTNTSTTTRWGCRSGALGKLQELNIGGNYTLFDDYLFSKDMTTLMVFISPQYESSDTGIGDRLVERIEAVLAGLNAEYAARGISADYFGAPAVAAYNVRQIKHDMMLTLNIAILVIVVFITLSFRNKLSVLLALIPVALGGLLALAVMSLVCHTISAIAVGAGTVVMGIALSYSIHILCHANHCHDPRQIIRDLAYPLTIGQHHDHRRLRRAAFHRLAAAARLRALRFADTGRNDAVQPRPAAPPDP